MFIKTSLKSLITHTSWIGILYVWHCHDNQYNIIRNDILQEVRCWSGQFVFIFPSQKSPNLNCGRSILFPWPRPTVRQLVEPGDWWEPSRDTADTGDQTRPGQTTEHSTELRPPGLSGWSDRGSSQFSSSPVWLSPHWRTLWRWDLSQNNQYH